jgi:hypothetical protein
MAKLTLASLKLSNDPFPSARKAEDPVERFRSTMLLRLTNNKLVAEGLIKGEPYIVRREQRVEEDGKKVKKMLPVKNYEPDFREDPTNKGQYLLQVKHGARPLVIDTGKDKGTTLSCKSLQQVVDVLDLLMTSLKEGVFDEQRKKKS